MITAQYGTSTHMLAKDEDTGTLEYYIDGNLMGTLTMADIALAVNP